MSASPTTSNNGRVRNGEWSPQTAPSNTTSSPPQPPHHHHQQHRKRRRTDPTTTTATAAATNTLPTRYAINMETGLMRDGDSPGLPRFVGSGSGIHFVRAVYDILARSMGPHPVAPQLVPGEDDQLDEARGVPHSPGTVRARAPFWREGEIISSSQDARRPAAVGFQDLVGWTRSYFEIWHPAFPFLHGPEVLGILELVAARGIENVSGPDAAIVRAMVSLALADARQLGDGGGGGSVGGPVPAELVFLSLDHVANCVGFVLGTPASLKNMQAALCVELFLVSMLKFNMASRLGGVVVRMAYHLGLHRCPRRYTNFSAHEVAMRKRIWWSFYCLERLVCQVLGLPLDVQDDDVDVCFPAAELHQRTPEQELADSQEESGQLQLLTMLSKHAQLRGMILELRHKTLCIRQDSIETALEVQSRLMKWANEVHEVMADDEDIDARDDGQISPLYRKLFVVLQHESTITLNRPLLARRPATTASKAALQSCIHASRAIIETVDDVQVFNPTSTASKGMAVSSALAVWPLLTWSVWMSCFILTYAALEGVTSVSSTQRYARRSLRILQHLSLRGTTWPDSCAEAVRQLLVALEKHPQDDQPAEQPNNKPGQTLSNGSQRNSEEEAPTRRARKGQQQQPSTAASQNGTPSRAGGSDHQPSPAYGPNISGYGANPQPNFQEPGIPPAGAAAPHHLNPFPQGADFTLDLSDQSWLLDPLSALDFSKFAQAGSAESAMGFTFY